MTPASPNDRRAARQAQRRADRSRARLRDRGENPVALVPPRDGLIVASYPRSGNKMTRTLLRAYANYSDPAIATLDGDDPARAAALEACVQVAVSPQGVVTCKTAPDELRDLGLFGRRFVLAKTHAALWPSPPDLTPRLFLYIVRHPLDVFASAIQYRHARGASDKSFDALVASGEISALLDAFIDQRGAPAFQRPYGSWLDHVLAGSEPDPGCPRLTLRFEDIAADPAATLSRIADSLGARVQTRVLPGALEAAASIRKIELGRGGRYLDGVISREQIARARDAFGPALDRFDYEIS